MRAAHGGLKPLSLFCLFCRSHRLCQAQFQRNLGGTAGVGYDSRLRVNAASLRLWAELFF